MKRIGILMGGGDCAGLNIALASVVRAGAGDEVEFYGFIKGWAGVLNKDYIKLDLESVDGISKMGGTILKTTNSGKFSAKSGSGEAQAINPEALQGVKQGLEELGIDGLIAVGGDGTLSGARQLADIGVRIVGMPKTIDNDLMATDKTFGFSTAVDVAVESIDRIHTTAESHSRVFFVELMGRHAGWLTLEAGIAGSAHAILLPEFPLDLDEFANFLETRTSKEQHVVVAVSEGIKIPNRFSNEELADSNQEIKLAGASNALMQALEISHPEKFDMRSVILGHVQRGGSPNSEDRVLASRYGVAAYQAYKDQQFGQMVRLQNGEVSTIPLATATSGLKLVTKDSALYKTAQQLGIYTN